MRLINLIFKPLVNSGIKHSVVNNAQLEDKYWLGEISKQRIVKIREYVGFCPIQYCDQTKAQGYLPGPLF